MIFPVIDLLRMIILHPDGATRLLKHMDNKSDVLMEMINNVTTSPPVPANLLTSIRAVTNLFKSSCYYPWLQNHRSEILDAFSSCFSSPNKNVQVSYATLILNYSVLLIESKDQEGQSQVLSAALEIAEGENLEVDSKFRALIAIGSLMLEGLVKRIALDFDVENIAKTAKASKDTKIAEVGADIELVVKQNWISWQLDGILGIGDQNTATSEVLPINSGNSRQQKLWWQKIQTFSFFYLEEWSSAV